jgi:hypothetical protein
MDYEAYVISGSFNFIPIYVGFLVYCIRIIYLPFLIQVIYFFAFFIFYTIFLILII